MHKQSGAIPTRFRTFSPSAAQSAVSPSRTLADRGHSTQPQHAEEHRPDTCLGQGSMGDRDTALHHATAAHAPTPRLSRRRAAAFRCTTSTRRGPARRSFRAVKSGPVTLAGTRPCPHLLKSSNAIQKVPSSGSTPDACPPPPDPRLWCGPFCGS